MDMVKMGHFLAELRKEHKLTQAELGEKLGVTNKTVSRWETGNYMPPVEMLEALSNLYGLTINELLSGRKLSALEYKDMAETNIKETLKASTFDLKEKQEYWKKKWRKDHFFHFIFYILIWLVLIVLLKLQGVEGYLIGAVSGLLFSFAYTVLHNSMMAYVENHIYSSNWNKSQDT